MKKFEIRDFLPKLKIFYDDVRNLDFVRPAQSERFGYDPNLVHRSSPSCEYSLKSMLSDMKISSADRILDIGSGKGHALRTFCNFPFTKIDGIELSEDLSNISKNNFKKLKEKRVTIYNANALSFSSYADYNIFYFYNPFPSDILESVIELITENCMHNNEEIIIIYNHPIFHESVIKNSYFKKVAVYPERWDHKIFIYSNKTSPISRLSHVG